MRLRRPSPIIIAVVWLVAANDCSDARESTRQRFLLYDVRIGEGFNLQKEIFVRAGRAAASLTSRRARLTSWSRRYSV